MEVGDARRLVEANPWIEAYGTLGVPTGSTAIASYRKDGPTGVDFQSAIALLPLPAIDAAARVGLLELGFPLSNSDGGRALTNAAALTANVQVTGGAPLAGASDHGATMLSLLASKPSASFPEGGLLPNADAIICRIPGADTRSPSETSAAPTLTEIADALVLLAGDLRTGGIVCVPLEFANESGTWPLEAAPECWHAIRDVTDNGVLVVASAGNSTWKATTPDDLVDFRTYFAGSLMVGSADPSNATDPSHLVVSPMSGRPWGPRIDCHSWGRLAKAMNAQGDVVGASGASAATMIVGAAAAVVQSAHLQVRPGTTPLNPDTLHQWLRSRGYLPRHPSGDLAEPDTIGIQPDLSSILKGHVIDPGVGGEPRDPDVRTRKPQGGVVEPTDTAP